ncbi:MAG: KilA-N domain-containing protein [Microcoleus sp. PH2017_11_PCY_U_A]|uniref:KilA-N domain-containing protein n=1 Tax=unclassified Microcoleus TaxID=2642155 RepID=UPI001DAA93EE|nr:MULTISPECIES: KilA-N domain-containing protein [unclassified Microcoleus]MCC3459832.1 KilA-N domain-containing protein [Microcoleus sp. PH2017_11_PCY_U_A]MCC3478265.1 KilA-N domain-containing protein [Microcoleus sp. PH2017_12_PCY_D_A]
MLHIWKNQEIEQNSKGYVCLTDMAKSENTTIAQYFRTKNVIDYIDALCLDLGITKDELIFSENQSNYPKTWVHPEIAIDFASWVSIPFRIWANRVLRQVLTNGGYIMPTATSEQLSALIKEANAKILAMYKNRSVTYKLNKKTGITTMTVFKGGVKEYQTDLCSYSTPSLVNPQVLIMRSFYSELDRCTIDIDSPMKEAYVRWRNYNQSSDRDWTRDELEEWIRVNFPLR